MNTYARLWHEYEELASSIGALNVTLCILQHCLLQLYDCNGVNLIITILDHHRTNFIQVDTNGHKDDSQYHLVRSMLTYISHNTGGLPDGTFLIAEDKAPVQPRYVFQQIFVLMGQEQHYRMMSGNHLRNIDLVGRGTHDHSFPQEFAK